MNEASTQTTLEQFRAELIRQGKSMNTVETYTRNVRLFIEWIEHTTGEPFRDQVSVFDGREYRAYLVTVKKQKPSTVNAKLEALQQFANYLNDQGKQEHITIGRQKAVARYQVSVLDKSSLYKCRRWASNHASIRDAAIFEVLLNTGLRVSELTALTLGDVELSERKGKIIVRCGKGGKYRELPLNTDARNALRKYLDVRPSSTDDHLFLGERGSLHRNAVAKIIRKIGQRGAGCVISPHVLRHTLFTRMAKGGVDLTTIADLAGHSSVELTSRYYVATTQEDREHAVTLIDF